MYQYLPLEEVDPPINSHIFPHVVTFLWDVCLSIWMTQVPVVKTDNNLLNVSLYPEYNYIFYKYYPL